MRNTGEHVGNCRLLGFLRHLVTSSQAATYLDGTTRKCWGISTVFSAHFLIYFKRLIYIERFLFRSCFSS